MGTFVAKKLLRRLIANGHYLQQTRVLIRAKAEYHIELLSALIKEHHDAVTVAVAHHQFQTLDLNALKRSEKAVVFDLKSMFAKEQVDYRL